MTRRTRTTTQSDQTLPRDAWASVGVYQVQTADGRTIATHCRGDAHADLILRGQIPFDVARREHLAAERLLDALRHRARPTPFDAIMNRWR